MRRIVVALGTPHTLHTPGKQSPDGRLREPVYCREIIADVEAILKGYGYDVIVDYAPQDPKPEWVHSNWEVEQRRELDYRVGVVNGLCEKYGKENVIYVSLHNNAAGNDGKWHDAGGFSVYTSRGQTTGDILAECIYDAAKGTLMYYMQRFEIAKLHHRYGAKQKPIRTDKSDGDSDLEANFYVLRRTQCAACLIEAMFQDSQEDITFLLSDEGRHAITRTLVEGIIRYINKLNKIII